MQKKEILVATESTLNKRGELPRLSSYGNELAGEKIAEFIMSEIF